MKTILYIDDNYEALEPVLQIAAEDNQYDLICAATPEEGLSMLQDYSSVIDVVLLDINFNNSTVQGTNVLAYILKDYSGLPVFMLTENDAAEHIQLAVSCIKMGAYDYITKRTLNTAQLFNAINNATQLYRKQHNHQATDEYGEESKVILIDEDDIQQECRYYFGFELIHVVIHNDIPYDQYLARLYEWNNKLMQIIAEADNNKVEARIIYKHIEQDKVGCYILFKIIQKAGNSHVHSYNLFKDLAHHLIFNREYYVFKILEKELAFKYYQHDWSKQAYRLNNYIETTRKTTIGFTKTDDSTRSYFPLPVQNNMDFSTDELLYYIGKADGSDYVCIDLMLSGLSVTDVEQLKIGVSEKDIIDVQSCNAYYNTILTHPKKLLLAQVTLFTEDQIPQNNYKNAIKKTFYGKNTNATWTNVSQHDCNFSVNPEFPRGKLAFTYTLNSINSVARLPMPTDFSRKQIAMVGKSFEQLPESLSNDGILIGEKRYSASKTDIFIDEEALFRHLYILGQTGTGKSTLIKSMALDVIQKGHGCCVIDPHGDLYEDIINNIPEHRKNDVLIFDTKNLENSLKLNLIHYNIHTEQDKSKVIQTIIQSLNQSYDMQTNAGFMFELFLRAAIFLALEDSTTQELGRKANLSDVQQIVDTESFRIKLLNLTKNDTLLKTFKLVDEMSGDQAWSNFIPYINSKLSVFTENAYLNILFNAQESTLNFRKIMDEKKILLVRFDKGQIGFGNLQLVGNLFFSLFVNDIMGRSELRREDRTKFFVFVDEFQNFLNQHISDALAEVRKYNISLTLANQSLGQLSDNVYQSLLGNVGNTIFFRPGNNDYEKIKHFLEPDFDRSEVLKLPNFNCFVKLLINNIPSEPFVMQTKQV